GRPAGPGNRRLGRREVGLGRHPPGLARRRRRALQQRFGRHRDRHCAGIPPRCRCRLDLGRPLLGGAARKGAAVRGRGSGRADRRPPRPHRQRGRPRLPGGLVRKLFAYRDARLLVAGQSLSAFGDWAMWIVRAVWMKTLTGASARAGLVFFALGLGNLAGPLGGLLADRVKRRPLMFVCDCVLGASVLVLLFVNDASTAWLLYVVALLYGVVGSVFYPARSALLRLMLPEELLAEANGLLSSVQQGLRIVAPLAGAGLYAAFGGGVVAILDAATFAGSALFLSRMHVREEKPEPPEHHFLREVTAGIEHVWRTWPLRQMTIGTTIALLVVGFTETLIFIVIGHLGHK